MDALVVFDSVFGNTARVARAIADVLEAHGAVRLAPLADTTVSELSGTDLLVMGGPTHRIGASKAMKAFLKTLPSKCLQGVAFAVFDTRYNMPARKSGSAAIRIDSRLRQRRGHRLVERESFFVVEREGPLEDGELERAADWARAVLRAFETWRSQS